MIPFGHDTVTLVQRTEARDANGKTSVSYATERLTGCSWRRTRRWQRIADDIMPYEGVTCRVPASQPKPRAGDLLILGDVAVTVTSYAEYQALIEQYADGDGAFVAASVSDDARPGTPLPHWAVRS